MTMSNVHMFNPWDRFNSSFTQGIYVGHSTLVSDIFSCTFTYQACLVFKFNVEVCINSSFMHAMFLVKVYKYLSILKYKNKI